MSVILFLLLKLKNNIILKLWSALESLKEHLITIEYIRQWFINILGHIPKHEPI